MESFAELELGFLGHFVSPHAANYDEAVNISRGSNPYLCLNVLTDCLTDTVKEIKPRMTLTFEQQIR